MYREWKEIELCWFRDVQRMEGNIIVFVWGCTENGRKQNSQKSILHEFWNQQNQKVDQGIDGKMK
jgi:hypothetical protein